MHGRLLAPAVALAALALTAAPAAAQRVSLTIADSGKTVTVSKGDTIRVGLPSNQTTPYHWVVSNRPDRAVVRLTRSQYVASPSNGMTGVGGTQRYLLKAVASGRTGFTAKYQELSTGQVGTGRSTFAVTIRVR